MWLQSLLLTSEVRHAEKPAIHYRDTPVMLQSIVHGVLLLEMGLLAKLDTYWTTGNTWAGLEGTSTNQTWWEMYTYMSVHYMSSLSAVCKNCRFWTLKIAVLFPSSYKFALARCLPMHVQKYMYYYRCMDWIMNKFYCIHFCSDWAIVVNAVILLLLLIIIIILYYVAFSSAMQW